MLTSFYCLNLITKILESTLIFSVREFIENIIINFDKNECFSASFSGHWSAEMSEMGNQQERLTRYRCDTASSDDYTSSAGSPVSVPFLN